MKVISICILLLAAQTSLAVDFKGSLADGKHTRYVSPISNPLFNETPYITTEIRPIFLRNELPDDFVTTGGTIDIFAAEIRVAINDRWGIIATKDGYADIDFDAVLPDETGSVNVSVGLKYAIITDPSTETLLTVGLEYEIPTGTIETAGIRLNGEGDGFLDVFISGATVKGRWGFQGNLGYNLALDSDHDSSLIHISSHINYQVTDRFYPVFELNVFSTRRNGERLTFDFEGLDLVNFGNTDAGTVVTAAVGGRYIFNRNVQLGVAYEAPVSSREDIIDWRFYLDLVISL